MPKMVHFSEQALKDIKNIMESIVEYTGTISTATKFYNDLNEHFNTLEM